MRRILLSWSSGKDSVWTLRALRRQPDLRVVGLITAFNKTHDRVAMHSTRRELVFEQARQVGIPLWPIELPWPCSNEQYEELMSQVWKRAVSEGVDGVAFGDLFLEEIRAYRERQLDTTSLEPLFPLWNQPTSQLAREMVREGLKAKLTCVDPSKLVRTFAGRDFDLALLDELPPHVDACGENGEFHTFVYDAPEFDRPIAVTTGEIVERDGFVFADVVPSKVAARNVIGG